MRLLSKEQNPEVCDATKADSSTAAGSKKIKTCSQDNAVTWPARCSSHAAIQVPTDPTHKKSLYHKALLQNDHLQPGPHKRRHLSKYECDGYDVFAPGYYD